MAEEYSLSLKNHVFISTLTDLSSMLKVDVHPGQYKFTSFVQGYVFAKDNYTPTIEDLVYIFHLRNGDRGLSGTYWNGESRHVDHLRIYNTWIRHHLDYNTLKRIWNDYTCSPEYKETEEIKKPAKGIKDKSLYQRPIKNLQNYHAIPVLFYLNIKPDDLSKITLELTDKVTDDTVIWNVKYDSECVGLALRNCFHNMVGDQAGVGICADAHAFGNFSARDIEYGHEYINADYVCNFQPCNCETRYQVKSKTNKRRY